jgi:hypothetical protein
VQQGEAPRELGGLLGVNAHVNAHDSCGRRGCEPQALSGSKAKMRRRSTETA